jgi:tripartite-type tricarboxylate transporter receptor subunit TctC
MAAAHSTLLSACRLIAVSLLCALSFPQAGAAQSFPSRPVKFVVPFSPGGLSDTVARLLGQDLSAVWGQQVLVDNRPGASGIIASELVAKSPADGYTLLFADPQHLAINPAMNAKLPYSPLRDFAPVTLAAYGPLFLVAHPSVEADSLPALIRLVKAKPGQLNYGSAGSGSIHHLTMESLKAALGLDIVHVPYKGAAQAVPALVSGQVALTISALPSLAPHVKAGKAKILAVSSGARSPLAPEVPTIAELAVPGFDFAGQIGIVAPAGTPREVIAKLNADISAVLKQPAFVARLAGLGIDPVGNSPEAFAAIIRADIDKYARAVKVSGATAD